MLQQQATCQRQQTPQLFSSPTTCGPLEMSVARRLVCVVFELGVQQGWLILWFAADRGFAHR
ncbi:hypothetical protein AU467_30035 [Mesorhizobium loti]|uniref:Uncharacterized protein n=1 Tax=Rhizobium loti TaxID=381 RepID=A0A101KP71_RHILI|nr:hypothetical protein AU467_30035 [Mesorhizobium loti]